MENCQKEIPGPLYFAVKEVIFQIACCFLEGGCMPVRDFVFAVQLEWSPGLVIVCIHLIQATSGATDLVCAVTFASTGGTLLKGIRTVITKIS